MIQRSLAKTIEHIRTQMPVIAILGPRQSGKTTLAQAIFKRHAYVNLEDLSLQEIARTDPKRFLSMYENDYGIIIDEFQHVPSLLSYIQLNVDSKKRLGYFVLTGSQNFLMNEAISQSLAGRVAICTLLPLAIQELAQSHKLAPSLDQQVWRGSYPRLYDDNVESNIFYPGYIHTYIERDVRQLVKVDNLSTFLRFIRLCAGRVGQELNISALATDASINQQTTKAWLSLLEASYIIFLVQPYFRNYSKRLVKSPKLYFYDTGLACSLLEITSAEQFSVHYLRGGLTESFMMSELYKQLYNQARFISLYHWRDSQGHEIDCIVEKNGLPVPIEIKASMTYQSDFLANIRSFKKIADLPVDAPAFVLYAGDQLLPLTDVTIVPWQDAGMILSDW